ncbi:Glutamate [NMDA] receptor subunit 1 [Hypsibius exemplaris]|uniref:Glutamate [NMDA] receptor subunit 1 n=1 Tax=Hypsibius exemplaris TaxID=2072580 RepID=A0A1W0WTE7_HYPEX|nr:Glutamate [NMDA] receptor subunit 1 [Hypsibius exemplaris]
MRLFRLAQLGPLTLAADQSVPSSSSLRLLILCLLFFLSSPPGSGTSALTINIGALLDSEQHRLFFLKSIQEVNAHRLSNLPDGLTLNGTVITIQTSPIWTAMEVCQGLLATPVHAILIHHPALPGFQLASAAASYTAGFYRIPIISISSRESSFSDKSIHKSFLRTVPPFTHQADIWVAILLHFGWKKIVVIVSGTQDGRMLLGRLQTRLETEDITIEKNIELAPGAVNITVDLEAMRELHSRVYLLYAEERDAEKVYHHARLAGLFDSGHVWLVTEQALGAANAPTGTLGLKLLHNGQVEEHIRDTIQVVTQALAVSFSEHILSDPPNTCNDTAFTWKDGPSFLQNMLKQTVANGRTGMVAFDEIGDRRTAEYQVINVLPGGHYLVVGACQTDTDSQNTLKLTLDRRKMVWPGGMREVPKGFMVSTHLKVLTVMEPPFTFVDKTVSNASECEDVFQGLLCYEDAQVHHDLLNIADNPAREFCCYGYSIDLLKNLSVTVNFTFDLHLSTHTQHVTTEKNNATEEAVWSGVLGQLIQGDGALAVAALTIMPEHAKYVDFSKPFKYLGITILEKKQPKSSTLNSFFQPFTNDLWVLVMVCLHVVALAMYLLDRFSPFSRYVLPESNEPEDDALNLSSAMWFAWGVLLNSGIGEGTPRSFGGRVLGMVWAGFAMIMVASYTANLAAFLVLDRPQSRLSGVNDARLRNPSENFTFATVRGSAVDLYFRRQVELATMYRIMEKRNYETSDNAVAAVKSGELQAFIWDSARLEYEAAKDKECELVTAGELFGRSGYGVALRKNSPWTSKITLAILGFHENGFMESLDNKYIYMRNDTQCVADENAPATLGLKNMAGVFILVGMGIAGGIILIIIEITYKRQQVKKQRIARITRTAYDRWRRTVERRKKERVRTFNAVLTRAATLDMSNRTGSQNPSREPSPNKRKLERGITMSAGI